MRFSWTVSLWVAMVLLCGGAVVGGQRSCECDSPSVRCVCDADQVAVCSSVTGVCITECLEVTGNDAADLEAVLDVAAQSVDPMVSAYRGASLLSLSVAIKHDVAEGLAADPEGEVVAISAGSGSVRISLPEDVRRRLAAAAKERPAYHVERSGRPVFR